MPEIDFVGVATGDCECFCWEVSEEEYIRICGGEDHKMEKEYRAESTLHKDDPGARWLIYPSSLLHKMGLGDEKGKMKFKLVVDPG